LMAFFEYKKRGAKLYLILKNYSKDNNFIIIFFMTFAE